MSNSPNLLVIVSDQHAPDAIGGLGHPVAQTPNLDRLLASGLAFRNAYCPYPMCTPSRAGFMTGHLTPQHGVWELGTPLPSDLPTWAHVLRRAGYATSISGRMHFVGHDTWHGFERRVHPDINEMPVPSCYGDWDRPQEDDHLMLAAIAAAGPTDEPTEMERFDAGVTDAAVEELARLAAGDQPWALTVGLFQPHFPYQVSRRYYDLYDDSNIPMPRPPPAGQTYEGLVPDQLRGCRQWLGLTTDGAPEADVRRARRAYYGMISAMDEQVGRLLERLKTTGAADNTWVVYLSDHGDNMGEHGFWSKLNFYEDSVRMPLIVAPPRYDAGGSACDALVSMIDWMPTVLELTGQASHFEPLPGRSLLPLLANPAERWDDRSVISDYACDGTRVPMRMVRRGRWKASFALDLPPTLFDLADDPHEWRDRSADPECRAVLAELQAIARADGWDPEALVEEIRLHKRRLKYVQQAESRD